MRVNVIMGGPSAEFDISILTGIEMCRHLMGGPHDVRAVVVTADRELCYTDIETALPPHTAFADPCGTDIFEGPFLPWSSGAIWEGCEVALLGVHGSFGEDGCLQGYLETIGIPYTGSGVFASSMALNKIATKHLLECSGVTTPPYSVYGTGHETTLDDLVRTHGFPCFAKCPQSGSSKLMGRADSRESLEALLAELSRESAHVLVESAITGVELSCPVLEYPDGTVRALPPVEIRPVGSSFFDYTAKYTDGACEEIVPAPQPEELLEKVRRTALRVHGILECSGVSRTDMICTDTDVYVLEINTLPGFTTASLVPKSYAADGGSYEELLELLIQGALRRHEARR
ncbi:MAG: D-alanine--D-alanine ligase [Chitinivibrionales bacterium]|nr:D-alanine--D-alanine ligase [Chitinivibrionales bacterium]